MNCYQNIWYIGTLVRTAWVDEGVNSFALAAGVDGYLYNQEAGLDDGSQIPALPIDAYIESSPLELGEGYQFSFIRRLIPDITFTGSNVASPTVDMTIKAQDFPGGGFEGEDISNVIRTATSPVERFTEQNYIRIRGRSFSLRVDSDTLGTKWRLGTPRIEIRQDGRR